MRFLAVALAITLLLGCGDRAGKPVPPLPSDDAAGRALEDQQAELDLAYVTVANRLEFLSSMATIEALPSELAETMLEEKLRDSGFTQLRDWIAEARVDGRPPLQMVTALYSYTTHHGGDGWVLVHSFSSDPSAATMVDDGRVVVVRSPHGEETLYAERLLLRSDQPYQVAYASEYTLLFSAPRVPAILSVSSGEPDNDILYSARGELFSQVSAPLNDGTACRACQYIRDTLHHAAEKTKLCDIGGVFLCAQIGLGTAGAGGVVCGAILTIFCKLGLMVLLDDGVVPGYLMCNVVGAMFTDDPQWCEEPAESGCKLLDILSGGACARCKALTSCVQEIACALVGEVATTVVCGVFTQLAPPMEYVCEPVLSRLLSEGCPRFTPEDAESACSRSCQDASTRDTCKPCTRNSDCGGDLCMPYKEGAELAYCNKRCAASQDCPLGFDCVSPGICSVRVSAACQADDVWLVDSCGGRVELIEDCNHQETCIDAECVRLLDRCEECAEPTACKSGLCLRYRDFPDIPPFCVDACTADGACDGAFSCQTAGEAKYCWVTTRAVCENDVEWLEDSCGRRVMQRETCGTVCVSDCGNKKCGLDQCGDSCGTCSVGFECTSDGRCIPSSLCGGLQCDQDEVCVNGQCCQPGTSTTCVGTAVHVSDSCGNPEEQVQDCAPDSCREGHCYVPDEGWEDCTPFAGYEDCLKWDYGRGKVDLHWAVESLNPDRTFVDGRWWYLKEYRVRVNCRGDRAYRYSGDDSRDDGDPTTMDDYDHVCRPSGCGDFSSRIDYREDVEEVIQSAPAVSIRVTDYVCWDESTTDPVDFGFVWVSFKPEGGVVRCFAASHCAEGQICDTSGAPQEWLCVPDPCPNVECGGICGSCLAGFYCSSGQCVACSYECTAGDSRCASVNTTQRCVTDANGCWAWSTEEQCGDTETCGASGVCECVRQCLGRVCGPDGCGGTCGPACPLGTECSAEGTCEVLASDECNSGESRCVEGAAQHCGDYDEDGYLEWGESTPCSGDETCVDGVCVGSCGPCEDGHPCTLDICSSGECISTPISGCCVARADCAAGDVAPIGAPDQCIDVSDAVVALQIAVGAIVPTPEQVAIADLAPPDRPDGIIDTADVVYLLSAVVGSVSVGTPACE